MLKTKLSRHFAISTFNLYQLTVNPPLVTNWHVSLMKKNYNVVCKRKNKKKKTLNDQILL